MSQSIFIKNVHVFTVDARDQVIAGGCVLVKDEKIAFVGAKPSFPIDKDTQIIDGKNKMALIPGLIDAHSHSSLLRGYTENKQLMDWLPEYQLEHQVLTEEDAYVAALLCYLEAIKAGTTCVMDMYRYMHRCAEAAEQIGIRAHLVPYVATAPGKSFFETMQTNEQLVRSHHLSQGGKIRVWLGMEHLFYCTPETYTWAAQFAKDHGVGIHTHSSEQKEEVEAVLQHFGKRPINVFHERGILGPNTVIAHCVWLDDEEIRLLADTDTAVAHCPISNAKLACGVAPIPKLQRAGIKVGLGTDGPISNNSLDLFEEMKFASLLQKNAELDASVLPAAKILRMATIEGARTLGMQDQIGSIEVGKQADLVLVDLYKPHLMPTLIDNDENPILWNLAFAARGSDVHSVFINGECILNARLPTRISEDNVLSLAMSQTQDLLKRRKKVKGKTVAMV
jgi:5-methylthioadenosine/S-adenosylhomocysteine deaminase